MRNFKGQRAAQAGFISSIVGWEQSNKDRTRKLLTEEGKKLGNMVATCCCLLSTAFGSDSREVGELA